MLKSTLGHSLKSVVQSFILSIFVLFLFMPNTFGSMNPLSYVSKLDYNGETGLPGNNYEPKGLGDFTNILSDGSLSMNIPLYQIPGKIPIDLNLSYKSGIAVDQEAGWVGLGWNLGGWSVKRETILGDDIMSTVHNVQNSRDVINDIYNVNIPGRSIKFVNLGTLENPIYKPLSHSNDSLYGYQELVHLSLWSYYKINFFVLVTADGTKYVFKKALKKHTIHSPESKHVPVNFSVECICMDPFFPGGCYDLINGKICDDPVTTFEGDWRNSIFENAEWLLTSILSHDYVDGGGDELDPLDTSDPRTDNSGYWVALQYSGFQGETGIWGTVKDINTTDTIARGPVDGGSSDYNDSTEVAYLRKILTPNIKVHFELVGLTNYLTQRYNSSGTPEGERHYDPILNSISVFGNNNDLGLAVNTEELFSVSFDYNYNSMSLKQYYSFGEPGLRRITFGTNNYTQLSFPHMGIIAPNSQKDTVGYEKSYSFTYYNDESLTSSVNGYFDFIRTNWSRGTNASGVLTNGESGSWIPFDLNNPIEMTTTFNDSWGGRDYWGYYYPNPHVWSLKTMRSTEGLEYTYEYEPNKFLLGGNEWNAGGCRVKNIKVNTAPDLYISTPANTNKDYSEIESYNIKYGYNNDGIGFLTSLPITYSRAKILQENIYPTSKKFSSALEFYQGDNVTHTINYPVINMELPNQRGFVKDYYITSDSLPGDQKRIMTYLEDEGVTFVKELDGYDLTGKPIIIYVKVTADVLGIYAFWQDRSPLMGIHYKTEKFDINYNIISSNQKFYTLEALEADLIISDTIFPGPFIGTEGFNLNDTVQASYLVQLDSVINYLDGVKSKSAYTYDSYYRLSEKINFNNGYKHVEQYEYESEYNTFMKNRHYLNALHSISLFERSLDNQNEAIRSQKTFSYRSDLPSQNETGLNTIWYMNNVSEWVDLDQDGILETNIDNKVLDVDKYGNSTLVQNPDGKKSGFIYSFKGLEGSFENISGNDFGLITAEGDKNNQPLAVDLIENLPGQMHYDSSQSFTGKASIKVIRNGESSTVFGPGFVSDFTLDGDFVADLWVKCTQPNSFRLTTATTVTGSTTEQKGVNLTIANEWTRIVCTLNVPASNDYHAYTALDDDAEAWVDDFRVYPITSKVTSNTYDEMSRISSTSNNENIPTHNYYNQYNQLSKIATYEKSPIIGQEYFYSSTNAFYATPGTYSVFEPNSVLEFKCREKGLIDDFSDNTLLNYAVTGTGNLQWDEVKERLIFIKDENTSDLYNNLTIPVEQFSNGFMAFDILLDNFPLGPMTSPPPSPESPEVSSLWFGFDNGINGYAVAPSIIGELTLFKYDGIDYSNQVIIEQMSSTDILASVFSKNRKIRYMLGKIDNQLYVFINNKCVLVAEDSAITQFSNLKIKIQDANYGTEIQRIWIDNLVFYNNPTVNTDFISSLGTLIQKQSFDGDKVIVSRFKSSLDKLPVASFNPISLDSKQNYFFGSWPLPEADHVSPFDFCFYGNSYFNLFDWQVGAPSTGFTFTENYFTDTIGTPDCTDDDGLLYPYSYYLYDSNPLRRLKETHSPGIFRDKPILYEYGTNELTLDGFNTTYYASDSVYKSKVIDEDGKVTVSFKDKFNRILGVVTDSSDNGINAYTKFYKDFWGNDTLTVQPEGQQIRREYTNNNWLVYDSSGDYGFNKYFYDKNGNLRFKQTASDRDLDNPFYRFKYYKYDKFNRMIEDGVFYSNASEEMTWANAFDSDFPPYGANESLILAEYEYDNGEFANGLLTKSVSYPVGKKITDPPASWEEYEYDIFGNITQKSIFIGKIDQSVPKRYTVEYDNLGNMLSITYPNGEMVSYGYNNLGQIIGLGAGELTSGSSGVFVFSTFDYWPTGLVKQKQFGYSTNIQTIDYKYNCRDWLLSINDGNVTTSTTGTLDHFSLELTYEDNAYRGMCQIDDPENCTYPEGYYNGNISSYRLKVSPGSNYDDFEQNFAYDNLNRLIATNYSSQEPQTDYAYDKNGNITSVTKQSQLYPYTYNYYNGPAGNKSNRLEYITTTGVAKPQDMQYTPSGSMNYYKSKGTSVWYNHKEEITRRAAIHRYDPINDLTNPNTDTSSVAYRYNNDGNRILKDYHYYYQYQCGSTVIDPGIPANNFTSLDFNEFNPSYLKTKYSLANVTDNFDSNIKFFNRNRPPQKFFMPKFTLPLLLIGPPPGEIKYCTTDVRILTGYYYNDDQVMSEYEGPNSTDLIDNYVYANGERIASFGATANDTRYYLNDHLGSTVATIDNTGTVKNKYYYRPYGEMQREIIADAGQHYNYTSKERDKELSLEWTYFGARYYDPYIKRFLQIDPLHAKYPGWSPYTYTLDNPIKFVDPNGEFASLAAGYLIYEGLALLGGTAAIAALANTDAGEFVGDVTDGAINNAVENILIIGIVGATVIKGVNHNALNPGPKAADGPHQMKRQNNDLSVGVKKGNESNPMGGPPVSPETVATGAGLLKKAYDGIFNKEKSAEIKEGEDTSSKSNSKTKAKKLKTKASLKHSTKLKDKD